MIKQFIQTNRAALDQALPDEQWWYQLDKMLNRLPASDAIERNILLNRILLDQDTPSASLWHKIEFNLDAILGNAPVIPDPLESFIQQHRDQLDTDAPDLKIWGQIAALDPKPVRHKAIYLNWGKSFMRAAAAIALLITGMGLGIWYTNYTQSVSEGMAMSEVSNDYKELEQYFQRDIATKQGRLASFAGNEPTEVSADLQQLDHAMEELRRDLANVPPGSREQVVRAMIENYKAKTTILQRVLQHLEDPKDRGNESNEKRNEPKDI
jgi:hypothetical protein